MIALDTVIRINELAEKIEDTADEPDDYGLVKQLLSDLLQQPLSTVSTKSGDRKAESGYDKLFFSVFRLPLSAFSSNAPS